MQAVILAGGAGTRLRPLTLNTPKPMIRVNGKPFLEYIIRELVNYGVNEIILCVGYLAEQFQAYFGDGSQFGVKIAYSAEKEFAGTGGALKLAAPGLRDDFLVVNGDTYLPLDYGAVYKQFKQAGKTGLLVVYDNREKIAEPNIAIDGNGEITAYVKQETLKKGEEAVLTVKREADCRYVDAGVQVFNKRLLDLIPAGKFVSLEVDVFPRLIEARQLASLITDQRYYDLGTPERLENIRKVLK